VRREDEIQDLGHRPRVFFGKGHGVTSFHCNLYCVAVGAGLTEMDGAEVSGRAGAMELVTTTGAVCRLGAVSWR